MSWDNIILDSAQVPGSLPARIDALLAHQRTTWQTFRDGEASLATLRTKELSMDGARVIVQANPGRRESVHARVDPESIARRPCLLCPEQLPQEERAVAFGELVLLPNPHPIMPRHLTAPVRAHVPQTITGRIGSMLELARAVGPGMLVLYNGARCGASAPDHFHFQAGGVEGVPLLEEMVEIGPTDRVWPVRSFGRRMLVSAHREAGAARALIERSLEVLSRLGEDDAEPLVNIVAVHGDGRYLTFVFPRSKHRPDCYWAQEDVRISVSPGALEMTGVLVLADVGHFDRIDEESAQAIYDEVSLNESLFARWVKEVS